MPKRKFSEFRDQLRPATAPSHDVVLLAMHDRIYDLLKRYKRPLFRALKAARSSERQKLGRRQKTAQGEGNIPDVTRLEAEVGALKGLDLATTAESHLCKTLSKIKGVAESPALPSLVRENVGKKIKDGTTATMNVQARLFKSDPIRGIVSQAMAEVTGVLGITSGRRKRVRAKDVTSVGVKPNRNGLPPRDDQASHGDQEGEEEWEGISSAIEDQDQDTSSGARELETSESEDESEDHFAARIAGSTTSNSEYGSDSDILQEASKTASSISNRLGHMSPLSLSLSPPPTRQPSRTLHPSSTTFLPSLLTSGYYSGDEDASSLNSDDEDSSRNQPRKNRMGQQARRALWEKKFGSRANHIRKGLSSKRGRDEGWDARKGARELRTRSARRRKELPRSSGQARENGEKIAWEGRAGEGTGANMDPLGVKRKAGPEKTSDVKLHPSWEAAKKVKQMKTGAAFEGKKVVF